MKKNILLKVWPDLTDYIPATVPFSGVHSKASQGKNLLLDFDNCTKVNSSGLNILLIQLLQLLQQKEYQRPWEFYPQTETQAIKKIYKLGLFSKLNKYSPVYNLFWDLKYNVIDENEVVEDLNSGEIIKSYPIFSIKIEKEEPHLRREALLAELRSWCYEKLFPLSKKFSFNFQNVINIITEIGKNTSDHTESDLFLGLDVINDKSDNYVKIHFSIGDIGSGINQHIKDNYQKVVSRLSTTKDRSAHWDLTFAYLWALTAGNTTKFASKANKGLGMASIIESSRKVPMDLSIFDARSRGILSNLDANELSHKKVRKNFHDVGKSVGFFYYGEILAMNRNL